MSSLTDWMDRTWYPGDTRNWDNVRYRELVTPLIGAETRCLDYGAGRGYVTQMNFRGVAAFMAGVDPTEDVLENPFLDEGKVLVLPDNIIDYPDASFDLVISANVIEHIADADRVFAEIHRVLKPGGRFIAKTPNTRHYMALAARLTPTWFHKFYNGLRGREVHDTFPTTYACNNPRAVHRQAARSGFSVREIHLWEGRPEYLRIFAPLYVVGYLYERLVNRFAALKGFRAVLVFDLEKR